MADGNTVSLKLNYRIVSYRIAYKRNIVFGMQDQTFNVYLDDRLDIFLFSLSYRC